MAVDERARHQLYNRVVEVLGEEEAVILMAHLPPGSYPSFATKQDLLDLEHRLKAELEHGLVALKHELKAHTLKVVLTANISTIALMTGIAFAAARLV